MVYVSIEDNNSFKIVKNLLSKNDIKYISDTDDMYNLISNSDFIISDFNFMNIKFALSSKKKIIVILDSNKKLSKAEKQYLKNKNIYCCKSEEKAVEVANYLIKNIRCCRIALFITIALLLFFSLFLFIWFVFFYNNDKHVVKKIDYKKENIVFLGDSITEMYDLNKYYKDMPVINSGISGYRTMNIYENLKDMVSIYNPTKVFLLIGTNDFLDDKSNEEIIDKIEKIVEWIDDNRPNAHIYLESIYPVNNTDDEKIDKDMVYDRDNNRIKSINNKLKYFCEEEKLCTYIDMYNELVDDEGNLRLEYTTEGLHISDKGYEVVTEKLMKYIEKVEK